MPTSPIWPEVPSASIVLALVNVAAAPVAGDVGAGALEVSVPLQLGEVIV